MEGDPRSHPPESSPKHCYYEGCAFGVYAVFDAKTAQLLGMRKPFAGRNVRGEKRREGWRWPTVWDVEVSILKGCSLSVETMSKVMPKRVRKS